VKDETAIAVAVVVVGAAVYLATRKVTAPDGGLDDPGSGLCGSVAATGDKAGGYGLLAGPACGVAEKIGGLLGIGKGNALGWAKCVADQKKLYQNDPKRKAEHIRSCQAKHGSSGIKFLGCVAKGYEPSPSVAKTLLDGWNARCRRLNGYPP
jgi:hypothetical protein